MSANALPNPRRVVVSNLSGSTPDHAEPAVGVAVDELKPELIFGGMFGKVIVNTEASFPADNSAPIRDAASSVPGSGIVLPGGANIYYLDLAPQMTSPMHRTPSTDYLVLLNGTATLLTPPAAFNVADGKGTYDEVQETVIHPGEVVVQRGAMHAWANRTDEWVRFLGVVLDAKPQQVEIGEGKVTEPLAESWLQ
ncbi:cupin 2 [Thozetella sp. PMI_491]|nr:cupin 2 [Thozetella sp. PMI_491]